MKFPRPTFGLKTLFVAIAVCAFFLYWVETQRQVVKARTDFFKDLHSLDKHGQGAITFDDNWAKSRGWTDGNSIPFVRQLLGDKSYYMIDLPDLGSDSRNDDIAQRTMILFPETTNILQFGRNGYIRTDNVDIFK